jgi:hypothetical protein
VHDCYDKRHPQEAVRDKGWECGGDGAQGTGLDWNGAGRLARPDVDPLSFIQEPNDAYFTTIPQSTFGIGSPSYCVPDGEQMLCSTAPSQPYPLNSWHMATNTLDVFTNATASNLRDGSGEVPAGDDCSTATNIYTVYNSCYYNSDITGISSSIAGSVVSPNPAILTCNAGVNKEGGTSPSLHISGDVYWPMGMRAWDTMSTAYADPFELVYILVIGNIDISNGDSTIIRTSSGTPSSSNQPDEGIRLYTSDFGNTFDIGMRFPSESVYNDTGNDLDYKAFTGLDPNDTYIFRFNFTENYVYIVRDSGVETYSMPRLLGQDIGGPGATHLGGYSPRSNYAQRFSSPKPTWDLFEWVCLWNGAGNRVSSATSEEIEEYLSWKYSILIPNRNFASCTG